MRGLRAATAFLLLCISIPAVAADNAIIIGQAVDLSGPDGSIGRDYVAGIRTYFDMVNAAGGIKGKRIHYVARDDRGQPQQAASLASELVEREQVDYLMGGIGDAATLAILNAPAVRRSGHLLFAPLAAAHFPPGARVLFWRPSYSQEVRHILSHFSKIGITDAAVVVQQSPGSELAYNGLTAAFHEHRMNLRAVARIGAHGDRIAEEAARMAAARPGFVLVIADTISTAQFLKAYRKHDEQTFVAGTSLINLSTLREVAGGRAVEWTVFAQVVPNPQAAATLLQVEHLSGMKKYRDEEVSSITLEGFAAAKALVAAIRQSKRGGRLALDDFIARPGTLDLGGMSATVSNGSNRLSGYVDIALFRKGSGLVF